MRFVKDQDGYYVKDLVNGETLHTKLCPVDATNMTTWAQSLVQQAQDVIDHGFGLCHDGTEYDLINYLCDTHGGNVPWNTEQFKEMYHEMLKLPNFIQVMDDFFKKYDEPHFYKTWTEHEAACEGEEPDYTLS